VTFTGADIKIIFTCLQALVVYPLASQAVICTYMCYATDFDTLRTSCLIPSIVTVLDFNVYSPQNACELCISSVPRDESNLQLWVR
jgi:hypothetical protein